MKRKEIKKTAPLKIPTGLKPYNIIGVDTQDVEIEMYGEVVETHPVDWWTGEPVEGLYIILKDFVAELEGLKEKNSVKVRINSPGGDLEAGVVIYNRLKELNNVTTVVDGLAASAAGLIFQAGQTRQIYSSGQFMAHGASCGLCGYYNLQDIERMGNRLKAANEQVINIFEERTGTNRTRLKHLVETETWLTGQEAVEEGFADEVINGEVTISMSADRSLFLCNGIPMQMKNFQKMPQGIKILKPSGQKPVEDRAKNEGGTKMTLEELRNQHPDLVKQIEDAAKETVDTKKVEENAVNAERQRIKEIESIEASIADKQMVKDAKYGENPITAKDLAFAAMQKQAALGNNFLEGMKEDAKASGTGKVQATPEDEQKAKDEADMKAVLGTLE